MPRGYYAYVLQELQSFTKCDHMSLGDTYWVGRAMEGWICPHASWTCNVDIRQLL